MLDFENTLKPLIDQAALKAARQFYGYTTAEDLSQSLWIWALERRGRMEDLLRQPGEAGVRLVTHALNQQAILDARKEREQVAGQDREDYPAKVIRTLLDDVFDYENWQQFGNNGDGQPVGKRIEATSDRIAMLIDVKRALDMTDPKTYSVIVGKWKYGYDDQAIATMLELDAPEKARAAVTRAITALRRVLLDNQSRARETEPQKPVSGLRRVASNASWRALTANQWDD